MQIQLSDHFDYKKLLRFALPSILMMVFTSVYGVVDGFFVSNFIGKTPFAALNLIYPIISIAGLIGIMLGTGGSALIGKVLGEGNREKANSYFSLITYVTVVVSLVISLVIIPFMRPISVLLGAEGEEMIQHCVTYGSILMTGLVAFMLQNFFGTLLVTAEKPDMGFYVTLISGAMNIFLDWLFIVPFGWGLAGAAWATVISQSVGGFVPLVYFILPNKSLLHLGKAKFEAIVLIKSCTNGASEFVTNISASIVSILFNYQLMEYAGEDGVSAYGVMMYIGFIFTSILYGYAFGTAPIISYHYGAQNRDELRNLFKKSMILMISAGVVMVALGFFGARPLSMIFVGYDKNLLEMTVRGTVIFTAAYLFAGINTYCSSFFTALNDGAVSAFISFVRTFVFQIVTVLVLPIFFELDGIWYSLVAAEAFSAVVSVLLFIKYKKKYHYA